MIIEDKQDKKVINPHLGVSLKPLTKN